MSYISSTSRDTHFRIKHLGQPHPISKARMKAKAAKIPTE